MSAPLSSHPPPQHWCRDAAGTLLYWSERERKWIQPHWARDSTQRPVFWLQQDQGWRYPQIPAEILYPTSGTRAYRSGPADSAEAGYSQSVSVGGSRSSSVVDVVTGISKMSVAESSASASRSQPIVQKHTDKVSGITEYIVDNPDGGVQSRFQSGPADRITGPEAYAYGLAASKRFQGTGNMEEGAFERLDPRFKVRRRNDGFYRIGRVFMMLYAEPAGQLRSVVTDITRDARWGESFNIKPRRFIVVNEGQHSCTAIAIWTYDHRGVAKPGVRKSDHAVVYSSRQPPENVPTAEESPSRNEAPLKPQQIRINVNDRLDALDSMSRVNFGKVYTVEHNVKVRDLGEIHPNSLPDLIYVFWTVQMENATRSRNPAVARLFQAATAAVARSRSDSVLVPPGQSGQTSQRQLDVPGLEDDDNDDDDDEEEEEEDNNNDGNDDDDDDNDDDDDDPGFNEDEND